MKISNLLSPALCCSAFLPIFALKAQYQADPNTRSGKPFTVSATLREEYDSNVFTSDTDQVDSFITSIEPAILFNYPMDETVLSFRYGFTGLFYVDRPGNDFDFNQDFTGRFAHTFSPNFDIDLRDHFGYSQEQQIGAGAVVQRRLGSNYLNEFSAAATAKWTERFSTLTTYRNNYEHYVDSSVGNTNNYDENTLSNDFRITVLPTTTAVVNLTGDRIDYETIPRSNTGFIFSVGADHYLTPVWLLSGRAGGEFRMYDNSTFGDQLSPYASLDMIWNYAPKSSLKFSYQHTTAITDISSYSDAETDQFSVGIEHYFTPKFSVGASAQYVLAVYQSRDSFTPVSGDLDENTANFNLHAGYEFNQYLSFLAGYTYSFVSSEVSSGRDYDRNQVYIGVRGTY